MSGVGLKFWFGNLTSSPLSRYGSLCAVGNPALPGSGVALTLSPDCLSPGFSFNADNVIVHTATGLCVGLVPSNSLTSVFATSNTNSLVLGTSCVPNPQTVPSFDFWSVYNQPPGYAAGIPVGGVTTTTGSGSTTKWIVPVAASSCVASFRASLNDENGTLSIGIQATTSTGVEFPYLLNSVTSLINPGTSGVFPPTSCSITIVPVSSTTTYPTTWLAQWNAMFTAGTTLILTSVHRLCAPPISVTPFSGYRGTSSSAYCYAASSGLDSDGAYLLTYSGWVGMVIDAGMNNGNLLPKFGAVPASASGGTYSAIYGALPSSSLVCTLTTNTGISYTLSKAFNFAQVSAVRQGLVMTHILVGKLCWVSASGSTSVWITPPQWWLEFDICEYLLLLSTYTY